MGTYPSRIYLASQCPRYRDSLKQIHVSFESLLLRSDSRRQVDVIETPDANETASAFLERICRARVAAGQSTLRSRRLLAFPVLTADSVVQLDQRIIGKPRNLQESAAILRELSGREHQMVSVVSLAFQEQVELRVVSTRVTFAKLDEARIEHYVSLNEGRDRPGAYAIEGLGGAFIERVEGSHSALFGLPLFETHELLHAIGFQLS